MDVFAIATGGESIHPVNSTPKSKVYKTVTAKRKVPVLPVSANESTCNVGSRFRSAKDVRISMGEETG